MIIGPIVSWWIKKQAKKHPEKNTEQVVRDFLKENNLEAIINIDDDRESLSLPKVEKEQYIKKIEKLPESKKEEILKNIENKMGLHMDQIQDEIVSSNQIAIGLHEAGHVKAFNKGNPRLQAFVRNAGNLSGQALALTGDFARSMDENGFNVGALKNLHKYKLPLLLAGSSPTLIQEFNASKEAYNEMKKKFGKEYANEQLKTKLAPAWFTYLSGQVIEPYALSELMHAARGKISKVADDEEYFEQLEKCAMEILEDTN
jgi:hypothetical protein